MINLLLKVEPVVLPSNVWKLFIIWKLYSWVLYSFTASSNAVKKFACCNSMSIKGYPNLLAHQSAVVTASVWKEENKLMITV